jgi:GT2 family glycosyltransferase
VVSEFEYFRPHTLLKLLEAASSQPGAVLVYGDEDRIDESGRRHSPWFKGDFDPEQLLGHDAVGRPALFRVEQVRACSKGLDPASSALLHDLALRVTEGRAPADVVHVPHVLCHRVNPPHTEPEASVRVVQSFLERAGIAAQAECKADPHWPSVRVRFQLPEPRPWVTVVVPTRNNLEMARRCVASVLSRTTYAHYDLLIVDNGSDDPECLNWLARVSEHARVSVRRDARPFNFSTLNNDSVREARGEFVALLNDDVEVITPGWLDEMLSLAARPSVGAVGARLLYADHSLQHGGVVVGLQGAAGHALKRLARGDPGPGGRARLLQSYLAVTGACLVVRRALYEQVGGMDEAAFAVAFNDVDLCLKLHAAGYRNLWTPHAELFHHESVSRGKEEPEARRRRLRAEGEALRARWPHWVERDPHYNPDLTLASDDFSLADPPRVALRRSSKP